MKLNGGTAARRRPRMRPEADHLSSFRPELRIVGDVTFQVAADRRAATKREGRPLGTPRAPSAGRRGPLAGMLLCAECGASFTLGSQVWKAGKCYRNLGCAAHREKGEAICPNGQGIAELKLINAIAATLRQTMADHFDVFAEAFAEEWRSLTASTQSPKAAPTAALDVEIRKASARVERLVNALVDNDDSEALATRLHVEEGKLRELRQRRAELPAARATVQAPRPPDAARVRALFDGLAGMLLTSPDGAREALAEVFEPFRLRPTVAPDGSRGYQLEMPIKSLWEAELRGRDLNPRPSGYEPDELPGCSTPRRRPKLVSA